MKYLQKLFLATSLISAAAIATPEKASQLYDDALKRQDKGDTAGAVVQLKNAIQQDDRMLAAHLLLGRLLFKAGDIKGSEASLERAISLGVSMSEVAIPLGQLYLAQGKQRKLLDQLLPENMDNATKAELLTMRGIAFHMTGNINQGNKSFAEAQRIAPESTLPLMGEATLHLGNGNTAKAKPLIERAYKLAPQSPSVLVAMGNLAQKEGNASKALQFFDQALTFDPKHVEARISKSTLLLGQQKDKEAEGELKKLKEMNITDPRISFMGGLIEKNKGNETLAKEAFNQVVDNIAPIPLNILSNNEQLLMTGALAHKQLGNTQKARELIEYLVSRNSKNTAANFLLAELLVANAEYSRALSIIKQLEKSEGEDPGLLYLRGTLEMQRKHFPEAAMYFERSLKANGPKEGLRELGITQFALGYQTPAAQNLELAFKTNPKDTRAGIQLAMQYAQAGNKEGALRVAEAMVKQEPENLSMQNFLANVKGRLQDKAGARQIWEKILQKDPLFRPVIINLSWLDLEERKFQIARTRVQSALNKFSNDPDLLFLLGTIEARDKKINDALRIWQKADEGQSNDIRPGLSIIQVYMKQRELDKALSTAQTLNNKYSKDTESYLALARVQISSGDFQSAKNTLKSATQIAEKNPLTLVEIGKMQLVVNNFEEVARNISRAKQIFPDFMPALALQAELDQRRGNNKGLEDTIRLMKNKYPNQIQTMITAGGYAMLTKQFPTAVQEFEKAMSKEPDGATGILLARAYLASNQPDKAYNTLETWSKAHPEDYVATQAFAEIAFLNNKPEVAKKHFEQTVAIYPEEAPILATYAALLSRLNDPKAITVAASANKLAPQDPMIMDLYGWLLSLSGNLDGGVRLLRDARLRQPQNPDIRIHLAYSLYKQNKLTQAKEEFIAAEQVPTKPTPSKFVEELQKSLKP